MYSETYSQARVNNTISLKFKIVSGVRQGSILSTFLFNHCIDWIMEQALSNDLLGLTLDDMMIADLDFADICLIDDKGNDAQKLLNNVTNNASQVGITLNVGKTKFCSNEYQKFYVHGEELKRVDEFTYLGSKIQLDRNVTSEVKSRIGKVEGTFNNLIKIWNQRNISQSMKVKLYEACLRSVLLYGCESLYGQ